MNESIHEEKNGTSHIVQNLTVDIVHHNSCYKKKNVWHSKFRILLFGSQPIMLCYWINYSHSVQYNIGLF